MARSLKTKPEKIYPAELEAILARAKAGDQTALPELKVAFDTHPDLAAQIGDLVKLSEMSLLTLAVGSNPLGREAIQRCVQKLREELMELATSTLERLLANRIVISFMQVHIEDTLLAGITLGQPNNLQGIKAATKRLDQAHTRFLKAVKALATVQKLLTPAKSPIEIATALEGRLKRPAQKLARFDRSLAVLPGAGQAISN